MNRFVCVNVGTKYPKEYTERLYNMVQRNTEEPFEFYVYTDQTTLYPEKHLKVVEHTSDETGWWCKLKLFEKGTLPPGDYLYMDLDVVILDNIDSLWKHNGFGIIRDFIRPDEGIVGGKEYNSSIVRFNNTQTDGIWKHYNNNRGYWKEQQRRVPFMGDQNVISQYGVYYPDFIQPFPDEWISSFKKGEGRGDTQGDRSQWFGRNPSKNVKVVVFHGDPSPKDILDDPDKYLSMGNKFCTPDTITWIKDNWK